MSITGKQTINIGLPNEPAGSDSLYTAFTKTQTNFDILFDNASPYNTFNAGDGITVNANSSTGVVTITNAGVTQLNAGTGITLSGSNGNITISSNGGGNGSGGTVTSVDIAPVSNTRLTVTGSPIVSAGTINLDLATSGVTAGTYNNPNVTIDTYGRIIAASNGSIAGTVTSVGLTPGPGVQISGGPITSNGNITVTNTGVLRLNAGAGILLSSGNGNVTISANTSSGTVTAVGVSSSQLVITGSPIVTAGTIGINLPSNVTFSGNVTAGGVKTDNLYYANGTAWDLQEAAGSNNQIQFNTSNNFAASANLTFNPSTNVLNVIGNITSGNVYANAGTIGASLLTGTLTTASQPNITSVGTLTSLNVSGNANTGNLVIPTGDIYYTPRYGAFYSNAIQTNPIANTAMAMTLNNTTTANGVSVVSNSQLTIAKPGIYNIQFSAQVTKTGSGTSTVDIWLAKNGNPVDWTNTQIYVTSGNPKVAAWNFVENVTVANTYYEIMWASADIAVALESFAANTGPTRPGTPSVIVSVTPVGA